MNKGIVYNDSLNNNNIYKKNNNEKNAGLPNSQNETIYFADEAFSKVNDAFNNNSILKNNNRIKYMVLDNNDEISNNNVINYLKKYNNSPNVFPANINIERTTNNAYTEKIVSLNGLYKDYINNPNCDKGVYKYIEKLKEQKIDISIYRVSYYENQNGKEKIYLDNGYIICLDHDKNLNIYDYVNSVNYIYEKNNNNYDLKNVISMDNTKDITEMKQINNIIYLYLKGGNIIEIKNNEINYIDIRKKLTEIAKDEINKKGSKYREWFYGYDQSTPWCAVFISWLYNQLPGGKKYFSNLDDYGNETKGQEGAGDIPRKSVKGDYVDSNYYGDWYESEYTDPTTKPQEGDIILFNPTIYPYDKYVSRHVGYVYKVDDDNVYTIEGNVGSNNDDESFVSFKSYNRKDTDINGYYRPNY